MNGKEQDHFMKQLSCLTIPTHKPTPFHSRCGPRLPENMTRPMWLPVPAMIDPQILLDAQLSNYSKPQQVQKLKSQHNEIDLYFMDHAHIYYDKLRHGYANTACLSNMVRTCRYDNKCLVCCNYNCNVEYRALLW